MTDVFRFETYGRWIPGVVFPAPMAMILTRSVEESGHMTPVSVVIKSELLL